MKHCCSCFKSVTDVSVCCVVVLLFCCIVVLVHRCVIVLLLCYCAGALMHRCTGALVSAPPAPRRPSPPPLCSQADAHPGRQLHHCRLADVYLQDDWSVWYLILWLLVEGGCRQNHGIPTATSCPPAAPLCHLSVPSAASYPSPSCLPHEQLLKSPGGCSFSGSKELHSVKST